MLNICAAVPRIKPSCLNSRAGDTTEFAKPEIGTIVPAPATLAMLSKTPIPVSIAVIIMTTAGVASFASSSLRFDIRHRLFSNSPKQHIPPPNKNANKQFLSFGELGLALSVIFE